MAVRRLWRIEIRDANAAVNSANRPGLSFPGQDVETV